jgi:tripartite-type tricarboxylate transporter receptor subunit TctC
MSCFAWAQAYPSRPVRIVVGFASAGPSDIVARLIGQWLSERLGKQFVIDNRPGAGGNIGTESVVRSPADGYTLCATNDMHGVAYSITSSARASNVGGTSRSRAFAVFRLITSSYFVGACTGRSAAFSPLSMRST